MEKFSTMVGFHSRRFAERDWKGTGWLQQAREPVVRVQAPGVTMVPWWKPWGVWCEGEALTESYLTVSPYEIPNTIAIIYDYYIQFPHDEAVKIIETLCFD